jgi:hypothetical protein
MSANRTFDAPKRADINEGGSKKKLLAGRKAGQWLRPLLSIPYQRESGRVRSSRAGNRFATVNLALLPDGPATIPSGNCHLIGYGRLRSARRHLGLDDLQTLPTAPRSKPTTLDRVTRPFSLRYQHDLSANAVLQYSSVRRRRFG